MCPKKIVNIVAEQEYQKGMEYLNKKNASKAERWLQYAANKGHKLAISNLELGVTKGYFVSTVNKLNAASIDLLEEFITSAPAEGEVETLEKMLFTYLVKKHHLKIIN